MGSRQKGRWKKAFGSAALFCGSLVLSGLAGEFALRLLGHHGAPQRAMSNIYPVADPIVDWRYVPHSEFRIGTILYSYNAAGYRDSTHSLEKPQAIKRIVVVGDSVTEGYGVDFKSAFSQVVQSRLGNEVEVITIAAGGLNTPQEIHLLEREGLRYQPDLVVLNFVLNDCDFYSKYAEAQRHAAGKEAQLGLLKLRVDPRVKQMLKSSALIYFVKERVENLQGRISGGTNTDYFTRIWTREENRGKVRDGFDRLAELGAKRGFSVVVMIWPLLGDYGNYGFNWVHEWIEKEARERGFARVPYRKLQVTAEDRIHPNATGHRIAAEKFETWYRMDQTGVQWETDRGREGVKGPWERG